MVRHLLANDIARNRHIVYTFILSTLSLHKHRTLLLYHPIDQIVDRQSSNAHDSNPPIKGTDTIRIICADHTNWPWSLCMHSMSAQATKLWIPRFKRRYFFKHATCIYMYMYSMYCVEVDRKRLLPRRFDLFTAAVCCIVTCYMSNLNWNLLGRRFFNVLFKYNLTHSYCSIYSILYVYQCVVELVHVTVIVVNCEQYGNGFDGAISMSPNSTSISVKFDYRHAVYR